MMRQLRIDSVGATHAGRVRTNNEDSFCLWQDRSLWAVADGMGGHDNGEWASARIIDMLEGVSLPGDFDAACAVIANSIHRANAEIHEEAERRSIQMGSTVVALHLCNDRFGLFWVGDSRGYVLRDGRLHQLTRDHSQVQDMVDRGLIRAEDAAMHPMSHVLARAIGVQPGVEVDAVADLAEPGDIFLLCSDGLTSRVSDAEIAATLDSCSRPEALDQLITLTLERGAPDNVTAILIGVNESTMLSLVGSAGSLHR